MATPDFTTLETWLPVVRYEKLYEVSNHGRIRSCVKRKNTFAGKILKISERRGYAFITLTELDGKSRQLFVHTIVAEAFIRPKINNLQINHKDCDKLNNSPNNLEWVTSSQNMHHAAINNLMPKGDNHHSRTRPEIVIRGELHHWHTRPETRATGDRSYAHRHPEIRQGERNGRAKITTEIARQIKIKIRDGCQTSTQIAIELNIPRHIVSDIKCGRHWKHVEI